MPERSTSTELLAYYNPVGYLMDSESDIVNINLQVFSNSVGAE